MLTQANKTPQATRHCAELLAHLCQTSTDGVLIVNAAGQIVSANPGAEAIFGYARAELIGQALPVMLPDVEQLDPNWLEGLPDHLIWMTNAQHKDGSSFPIEMAISRFHTQDETLALYLVRDLSDLRSDLSAEEELSRLSPRQRQVLQLVARGFTSREIAQHLTISVKTVETHRANIMSKLGVRNVTGLVRFAVEIGLA